MDELELGIVEDIDSMIQDVEDAIDGKGSSDDESEIEPEQSEGDNEPEAED